VKVAEIEPPPGPLLPAMLADNAIKPAFQAAGQGEIRAVNRQNQRIVEHGAIEPIRYNQIDPV
jgi:hypothetical protein